jgi:hypothetical protein
MNWVFISQKTFFIVTAVKTSNLTKELYGHNNSNEQGEHEEQIINSTSFSSPSGTVNVSADLQKETSVARSEDVTASIAEASGETGEKHDDHQSGQDASGKRTQTKNNNKNSLALSPQANSTY